MKNDTPSTDQSEVDDADPPSAPGLAGTRESAWNSDPSDTPDVDLVGEGEPGEAGIQDTGDFLKGLLEAVLFVADHPLELKELARAARVDRKRTAELVEELREETKSRGISLQEVAGGYAFRTNPHYSAQVRHFLQQRPVRLSRPQLETLAIVSYRQPITRPEIDDIRGVDSGPVLKGLLERDLIRIIGKKDEPGRPMLYGTTNTFLEVFSLRSLSDLPTLREFAELSEESRRAFEQKIGEAAPEGPVEASGEADTDAVTAEASTEAIPSSEQPEDDEDEDDEDDEDDDDDDDDEDDDDDDDDDDKKP